MIEKDKALQVAKSLIEFEDSILDTKYSESHQKVAIKYKDHLIEIIGGDNRFIKYLNEKIPLSANEYKQIYSCFCEELTKRREKTAEKFSDLEKLISAEKSKKTVGA
jgi:hypothetical protein